MMRRQPSLVDLDGCFVVLRGRRDLVTKNWMLLALALAIPLARAFPWIGARGGPLLPEVTVKYGAVSLIFFLSGISLQPRQLSSAASKGKLHVFVQGFTLGFVPLFVRSVVAPAASLVLDDVDGLIAVSCMPPPVSSAVILTKAVGGNEAAAIFNSALGSLLGVFVTPFLLVASVGTTTTSSRNDSAATMAVLLNVLRQLATTVLVPLCLGQVARPRFERLVDRRKREVSVLGQATLLLIIYTTFCDSFFVSTTTLNVSEGDHHHLRETTSSSGGASALAGLVVIVVSLQLFLLGLVFVVAEKFFSPEDVVSAVFCATHKSLTLGVPVMRLVFADHPRLPLLTVPLLVYHPTQILVGGVVCPAFKAWLRRRQPGGGSSSMKSPLGYKKIASSVNLGASADNTTSSSKDATNGMKKVAVPPLEKKASLPSEDAQMMTQRRSRVVAFQDAENPETTPSTTTSSANKRMSPTHATDHTKAAFATDDAPQLVSV